LKTNVLRIIEANKINYSVINYEVDESALDAVSVADKINADSEQVFKTLVATGESKYFVFCIPGNYELNLKKAALAAEVKKIDLIPLKELTPLTGYIRGGCSPIGMKKQFPTFIDESAQLFDTIFVSAGARGTQVKLNPDDLSKLIGAKYFDLI